jgi:hypothetical protein
LSVRAGILMTACMIVSQSASGTRSISSSTSLSCSSVATLGSGGEGGGIGRHL